jgi:hypothetical protein
MQSMGCLSPVTSTSNCGVAPSAADGSGEPVERVGWRPSLTTGGRPGHVMVHFQVQGGARHTLPVPSSVVSPPPGRPEGLFG